jgi:hypothetical protein
MIFYWLTPVALLVISYKALANVALGYPCLIATMLVSCIFMLIYIRAGDDERRKYRNLPAWMLIFVFFGGVIC